MSVDRRPPTRVELAGVIGKVRLWHAWAMGAAALFLLFVSSSGNRGTAIWRVAAFVSLARVLAGVAVTHWSSVELKVRVWRTRVGGAPLEWGLWVWAIAQQFGVIHFSEMNPTASWWVDVQCLVGIVALSVDTRAFAAASVEDVVRHKIDVKSGYIAMADGTRIGHNLAWLLGVGVELKGEEKSPDRTLPAGYRTAPPKSVDPTLNYDQAQTWRDGQSRIRWASIGSLIVMLSAAQALGKWSGDTSLSIFASMLVATAFTFFSFWLPLSKNVVLSVEQKSLSQLWIIAAVAGVSWGLIHARTDSATWAALSAVPVAIRAAALNVSILALDVRGKRRPRYWIAGARASWSIPLENAVNRRFDAKLFSVDRQSDSTDVGYAPALSRYLTQHWDNFKAVKERHREKLERRLIGTEKRSDNRGTNR